MRILSNRWVRDIKPYKLASHKIWEIMNGEVLKLDWNESTIPPAPIVLEKINEFLDRNLLNIYPDTCNQELISRLSKYSEVDQENIQYFASSDAAHEYIVRTFINPGDEIIIQAPTYDNFRVVCESAGALLRKIEKINSKEYINECMVRLGDPAVKAIYLCNPNNPTGEIISIEDLSELARKNKSKLIIVDEAYYEFSMHSASTIIKESENIIVTRTFSKAFGLAQMRIGYIIAPKALLEEINKIRNAKSISMVSQVAAIAALQDVEYMRNYVQEVEIAKLNFISIIRKKYGASISIGESYANFVMITLQSAEKMRAFRQHFESNNIFIRPLEHLNLESSARITIGTSEQMKKVLLCMEKFYNEQDQYSTI